MNFNELIETALMPCMQMGLKELVGVERILQKAQRLVSGLKSVEINREVVKRFASSINLSAMIAVHVAADSLKLATVVNDADRKQAAEFIDSFWGTHAAHCDKEVILRFIDDSIAKSFAERRTLLEFAKSEEVACKLTEPHVESGKLGVDACVDMFCELEKKRVLEEC